MIYYIQFSPWRWLDMLYAFPFCMGILRDYNLITLSHKIFLESYRPALFKRGTISLSLSLCWCL